MRKKCSKAYKGTERNKEEDDTMSAAVKDYAFRVISKGKESKVPSVSKERMAALRKELGKYLKNK